MSDDEQAKLFEIMVREVFSEAEAEKQKKPMPAGAAAAVTFFTVCSMWLFAIALLMPAVWLIWTFGKWLF
jgi:flagellar biogenesis protein FliO